MINSKAWDWEAALAPQWKEPASEIYPLINRWQKQNFKKILDLGCGVGRHALFFSKNGFEVSACDLSKEGIDELITSAKEENIGINTKVCDMLSLPYKDSLFDCLIAYHAIYHSDDEGIRKTINEIKRVIKNEGEAYITFNTKYSSSFKDPKSKRLTENTLIKTKGHEAGIPHYFANRQDVELLLKDFEIIEFFYKEEYWKDYTGTHYFVLVKNIK